MLHPVGMPVVPVRLRCLNLPVESKLYGVRVSWRYACLKVFILQSSNNNSKLLLPLGFVWLLLDCKLQLIWLFINDTFMEL